MDAIEKLKAEARAKRDAAIKTAKLDYRTTLALIAKTKRQLERQPKSRLRRCFKPAPGASGELEGYTAVAAAEVVLAERGPLTLVEIAAEIQARGCRSGDDPRTLVENLRGSLKYHQGRFERGEDGRWQLVR